MKNKRRGGFVDPVEETEEVETPVEKVEEVETLVEKVEEVETPVEMSTEIEADPVEEIEEVETPVEKTPEPKVEKPKSVKNPKTTKVLVIHQAINIRNGPGFQYTANDVATNGRVFEILEENNNWGRIGENRWISLSELFVERL